MFDLRDLNADRQKGIRTLAGALGAGLSYRVIYIVLAALMLCGGYYYFFVAPAAFHAIAIMTAALAAFLSTAYSRQRPHPFVYSGWIDGVMLLYGILLALK